MPFPTGHLLIWISTSARTALAFGIDRLGVDHRRTRTGIAPFSYAGGSADPVAKPLKEVQLPPFPEMVCHGGNSSGSIRHWQPLFTK